MSRYDDSLVLGMLEVENELEGEKQSVGTVPEPHKRPPAECKGKKKKHVFCIRIVS